MNQKIKKQKLYATLIFCVILTVSILLLTWFAIHLVNNTKNQIESELEIELARLERALTDKIDHTFSITKNINSQIAEDPTNKVYINEILKRYRTNESLTEGFSWTLFSWSDSHYQITVDSKYGIMKEPFDLSIRDYISLTEKEPGKFQIGTPVIGSTSRKWMIPGGVGLADQNGKYLGAITIGFEIEILAKLLHNVVQNSNIKFSLISKNEVSILYGDMNSYGIDKTNDDHTQKSEAEQILNKINSTADKKSSDISLFKNRHAFLAKKVADYPYILFLKYDEKAIWNSLWNLALSRLIEILSISSGLIILLILIYRERQQSQKIIEFKQVAEEAGEAKAAFLARSAHEFRNFVFGIQGCAEIIKNDLEELISNFKNGTISEKKNEIHNLETDLDLSNNIIDASQELSDFINDLINLNQTEPKEFKITKSRKPVNLSKLVKQATTFMKKKAKNSDIILITKVDKNLHSLPNLDARRIKQVIMHLVSNAIKYSPKSSVVEITAKNFVEKKDGKKVSAVKAVKSVEIIVKDQGRGMSASELKNALQKNNNLTKSNIGKFDYGNLGLPIVKYLIEKQGGTLEIKSEKNKGSEIRIIL